MERLFEEVRFDQRELVPAIIQDARNKQVLMLGYMNKEALRLTISTGKCHFWSRSRKRLWMKGETSGHVQDVQEIRLDCDGDTILILVEQEKAACHKGYRSCFYRKWEAGELKVAEEKVFQEDEVYRSI
ncbi:MAG: phosphoribosyl-AMP cyclohydrolase [Candidatus Bathyarchaeia archaeon]